MWKLITLTLFFLGTPSFLNDQARLQGCLPSDVKMTDVIFSVERGARGEVVRKLTIEQRLKQLRAHCRRGKLVDASNKEIYFYKREGCWGNPPADYLDIMTRQRRAIENLKRRYTVIEISCNSSGKPIQ